MSFFEDAILESQLILQVRKEESVSELSESELSDKRKSEVESGQGPSFFTVSRVREIGCFWGNPVKSTVDP